jgi:MerR family transcriptional regulator, light-induced transcriptional regulator
MTTESQVHVAGTPAETPAGRPAPDQSATLSIGDLADRTGLSAATLRMWESRHGFPVPHRLESGHRRYREEDVDAIRAVVRHKDAGTRLELAILNAMADAEPAAPSIYAFLRRRHPGLGVHRLRKSTLMALSWAIEDEFCAKADQAAIYASFQRERYFRSAEPRWTELARVARAVTVFADFAETDPDTRPVQVALPADAPMRREWAVVCDSRELPVVLTAWELPGQEDVPEPERLFESMWTVDGAAVHDAARVCESVARAYGGRGAPESEGSRLPAADPTLSRPHTPDLAAVTGLFNRMVAYVDRIGA